MLDQQEAAFGGRDAILDLLTFTPLEKKGQLFLNMLADPRRRGDTLTKLAKEAGLRPLQVMELLRSAAGASSTARALTTLSQSLPAVVQDLTEKAVDAVVQCPDCAGSGLIMGETCLKCNGRKTITRPSDLDRQKIVLETTGILRKAPSGVNVQVNQQVGAIHPSNFFSKFVRQSDTDAYDVTVEPVDDGKPQT